MDICINGNVVSIKALNTAQIADTYNELATALGESTVNRFATRSKAESRLIGIADRYNEQFPLSVPTDLTEEQAIRLVQKRTADGASVLVKAEEPVQLSEDDKAQVTAEAQSRAPASGTPRWAKPKREEASKVAYRPRPGSSQHAMYKLLVGSGINIDEFCSTMVAYGYKDKTLHQPSTVWSCLRYLFVSSKGYGLDFDGARIRLLIPADERDAVRTAKEA